MFPWESYMIYLWISCGLYSLQFHCVKKMILVKILNFESNDDWQSFPDSMCQKITFIH